MSKEKGSGVTGNLSVVPREEVKPVKLVHDKNTGEVIDTGKFDGADAVALKGHVKKTDQNKPKREIPVLIKKKGGGNLLTELMEINEKNGGMVAEESESSQVTNPFPLKPRIEGKFKANKKANAPFESVYVIHTPKAYDVLNGRPAVKGSKKRVIPNVFSFASRCGVIIDYAFNGENHIMAYQFLLKIESMIAELTSEIDKFELLVKELQDKYTEFGVLVKKLESNRPSSFVVTVRNPYALRLFLLALKYDHIERIFLPLRENDFVSAQDYRETHRPIQALFNSIKTLPDMFSSKRKFNGAVVDGKGKLAESLDLMGYAKYSKEAETDPVKAKEIEILFKVVGEPSFELIEGKLVPELLPALKPLNVSNIESALEEAVTQEDEE